LLSEYVEITEVHPTANGGKVYLANALKGYGGKISFALGVDAQSAITGIEITSESETAGLGANCENDEFKARFKGIKAPESTSEEMYNKNETTDTQVQALSGATVTSRAITRAVKGILFYDASGKEAGQYE